MKFSDEFLYSFLVEENGYSEEKFECLTEDEKMETIRDVAKGILDSIQQRLSPADTIYADVSRGDIKMLRDLQVVQDAITKLEKMLEGSQTVYPNCNEAIQLVVKSILYINQYSSNFKDAYRNKKAILIMNYQALIIAIITAVSYIQAKMVEMENNKVEDISLDISPIKTLQWFIRAVENGEFRKMLKDVAIMRENYVEYTPEKLGKLIEGADVASMVIDGIKSFYDNLDKGGRVTTLIYKAVGLVMILFAVREVIYMISRSKFKVRDMLENLKNFTNQDSLGNTISTAIRSFATKFVPDIEHASEVTDREIKSEDKDVAFQVRQVEKTVPVEVKNDLAGVQPESTFTWDF